MADSLTSHLLSALKPLIEQGGLIAYSGNQPPVRLCARQSGRLLNGIPLDAEELFGRQLAFNMLPLMPDPKGSVREERRLVNAARKVLQDDGLMISASLVQSPVFYGHTQIVNFKALRPLAAEEARDAFDQA